MDGQLPLFISVYLWHLFSARVVRILLNISHFIRMYYAYVRTTRTHAHTHWSKDRLTLAHVSRAERNLITFSPSRRLHSRCQPTRLPNLALVLFLFRLWYSLAEYDETRWNGASCDEHSPFLSPSIFSVWLSVHSHKRARAHTHHTHTHTVWQCRPWIGLYLRGGLRSARGNELARIHEQRRRVGSHCWY